MGTDDLQALCHKARQALADGNAPLARQTYFQALAQQPDNPDVHYGLATTCFMLQDFNGAIYHFNEVIRLEAHRVGAYINLGAVYNQMNRPDDALNVLRQAIKLDGKKAEAYYNLGLAYRLKGQLELAIQAYREATHLNPNLVDAFYNLANSLQDLGRHAQAAQHYKRVLAMDRHFEAARIGLQQAEQAMHQHPAPASVAPSTTKLAATGVDMNQPLDPTGDGPALRALHRTTAVAENTVRDLHRVLEEELEPAIKELSSALLTGRSSVTELSERLERFELAMNRTRALKKTWQQNMQILRELNDKLMTRPSPPPANNTSAAPVS
jgi:tetratricopeptide (TPR) repeat protein